MADSAVDGLDAGGRSIRSMQVRAMVEAETSEQESGETQRSGGEEQAAAALPIRVTVSADRSPLDAQITQTRWLIISSALLIVACGATTVGLAIARGLRPLNRLSAEVAHIQPGSEHARLATAYLQAELRPIASQVNALLDRAHTMIERERGFASAASHEFRTPIAEARMLLEVALRNERSEPEWRSTARSSLEVLARMQSLVDALLAAARHARVDMQALREPSIEACAAITKIVDGACVQLDRPRHSVTIEAPQFVPVQCSGAAFESIVGNLVRNALEHGVVDAASPVRVEVLHDQENRRLRVSVLNQANGLSHADLDRMFDPLWRKDAARAGDGHFGLGLSVARTLASAFGGSIIASMPDASTIRVDVELPAG
ncbi:MAG: sensor histidine kinase [Proteobacteria bacterium]|nr:sensor histidine kinase [Pseudomonadota bacterium]